MAAKNGEFSVLGVSTKHERITPEYQSIEIDIPVKWMGITKLVIKVDDTGLIFIGKTMGISKEHVQGIQYRTYESLIEREVLNY